MMTFAFAAALLVADMPNESRLAVISRAPAVDLITQDGKPLRLSDLKGKVLVVSFVFTTCSGTCPATTHRLSALQAELKRQGLLQDGKIHLLSITLDPERDTPDVLRRYMKLYDADPQSWTFLTGPPAQVKEAFTAWGMWARPAANAQLDHPSRIFLVDPQGRIREIYHLGYFKAPWVVEDIRLLLARQ
ncbi:MAG: SCO family protein [Gemmataceae bacterium]